MKIIKLVDGKKREVSVESYSCKNKKCLVISSCNSSDRKYYCRTRETKGCPDDSQKQL